MSQDFLDGLRRSRLLAIVRGTQQRASVAAALTLLEEGFRYLEISLNTPNALEVMAEVVREAPAGSHIGAGTVLTLEDADRVRDAGVTFAVTPVVTAPVLESAAADFPIIAGALTPTESWAAMQQGATAVKLFPASTGGPGYLKAVRDPLPGVPFVPVGGVAPELVGAYLSAGAVAVGLGGPLLGDAASGGDLDELRSRARRFRAVAAAWEEVP